LKDSWANDENNLPISFGKNNAAYLKDLHEKLKVARDYALSHSDREQKRYTDHYNLRSRNKQFVVGDHVLILMPDSTSSKTLSKWTRPATVVAVKSLYSYIVQCDGVTRHVHANKLRKFHVRVESVTCDLIVCQFSTFDNVSDENLPLHMSAFCAIVYDVDVDFGDLHVVPDSLGKPNDVILPSEQIDPGSIGHLEENQQKKLLDLLNKNLECFFLISLVSLMWLPTQSL